MTNQTCPCNQCHYARKHPQLTKSPVTRLIELGYTLTRSSALRDSSGSLVHLVEAARVSDGHIERNWSHDAAASLQDLVDRLARR